MQIPEEYLPLIAVAAVLFIVLVLLCTILFFKIWGMTNNIIKIRKHALAHDNRLVAVRFSDQRKRHSKSSRRNSPSML